MKKLLFFSFILIISSCNVNETEKQIETQKEKEEKLEEQKNKLVLAKYQDSFNEVSSKYKVEYEWDDLSFQYSYEYQPILKSNCQIIKQFTIDDIYLTDTSYFVSLNVGKGKNSRIRFMEDYIRPKQSTSYNFKLYISKDMIEQLTDPVTMKFLLVKVDSVYKVPPLEFRGKGRIIEIFSVKK